MLLWIDAQLPPSLVGKFKREFGVSAAHVFDMGMTAATDGHIFENARAENAVVMTKDEDLVHILERRGPPPQILWITLGNVSNAQLWAALSSNWLRISRHLDAGEPLVELSGKRTE